MLSTAEVALNTVLSNIGALIIHVLIVIECASYYVIFYPIYYLSLSQCFSLGLAKHVHYSKLGFYETATLENAKALRSHATADAVLDPNALKFQPVNEAKDNFDYSLPAWAQFKTPKRESVHYFHFKCIMIFYYARKHYSVKNCDELLSD